MNDNTGSFATVTSTGKYTVRTRSLDSLDAIRKSRLISSH